MSEWMFPDGTVLDFKWKPDNEDAFEIEIERMGGREVKKLDDGSYSAKFEINPESWQHIWGSGNSGGGE
jgi:hypothetical protein